MQRFVSKIKKKMRGGIEIYIDKRLRDTHICVYLFREYKESIEMGGGFGIPGKGALALSLSPDCNLFPSRVACTFIHHTLCDEKDFFCFLLSFVQVRCYFINFFFFIIIVISDILIYLYCF